MDSKNNDQLLSDLFSPLSNIAEEKKEYLFKPFFPLGKITLLSADPGTGKTKFALGLSALVTKGLPLLGIPCGKAGRVLLFSSEDDASDIKQTVLSCGGDEEKIIVLSEGEKSLQYQKSSQITFNSPIVEQAIDRYNPVLVCFDPYQRYAGKADPNKSNETNLALKSLDLLGKKYGCSFLIVCHNNKNVKADNLMHRTSGSVDIAGNARSILSIVHDPEKPDELLAIHSKSNNKTGRSIRYAIRPIEGNEDFATVQWIGLEDYTESDYRKSIKKADEQKYEMTITDDDIIVSTIIGLMKDNPNEIRIRKEDLWTAVEKYTGQITSVTFDDITKKYRSYLWNNHNIYAGVKTSQGLKPFRIGKETFPPSKPNDRCLALYKKKTSANIHLVK